MNYLACCFVEGLKLVCLDVTYGTTVNVKYIIKQYVPVLISVVSPFYRPTRGATEYSDWATTNRGWVSGNTSGYNVWPGMFSTVARLGLTVVKVNTPVYIQYVICVCCTLLDAHSVKLPAKTFE